MSTDSIIQLISIVLSSIISIASIIIVVLTLKQNSKMIRDSTRPYVSIYFDFINTGSHKGFFVIRNFGKTSAKIVSIVCNEEIRNFCYHNHSLGQQFERLQDVIIAPNQKFLIYFDVSEVLKQTSIATFDIAYTEGTYTYKDHFSINLMCYAYLGSLRSSKVNGTVKPSSTDETKIISYTLQEIVERIM